MEFILRLKDKFLLASDAERAGKMSQYMRQLHPFYGVMAPERKQILKSVIKELGLPTNSATIAKELFKEEERELHICAQELMQKANKQWTENSLDDFKFMLSTKSWWDTVDFIASNLVGPYLKKFPKKTAEVHSWADTDNIWLQRTTILYQLKYKSSTDSDWLAQVIHKHKHQKEFFIKKAIGWSLREYARSNPAWVRDFVQKTELQPLSKKEALKHF